MSYVAKGEKEYDATGAPLPGAKIHKIRITLTSSNVKNLEKCMLHSLDHHPLGRLNTLHSFFGSYQQSQGQTASCQGTCPSSYKSFEDHDSKNGLWNHSFIRTSCWCLPFNSLAVRVQRPGIATSSKSTSDWLTYTRQVRLSNRL